jgi:hypothetical protein
MMVMMMHLLVDDLEAEGGGDSGLPASAGGNRDSRLRERRIGGSHGDRLGHIQKL